MEDVREHVREVELPNTRALPTFDAGVRVLGRRLVEGTMLAWVICDVDDDDALKRMADGRARVRTCTLEAVYLAIAQYGLDYVDTRKAEVL